MIGAATNHLWQTTLFAIAVGVLTLAFRGHAARVRYWLWFSASCKFLIPFALLMTLGSRLERDAGPQTLTAPLPAPLLAPLQAALPAIVAPLLEISQPFPGAPLPAGSTHTALHWTDAWTDAAIISVWACGFLAVVLMRFRGWLRIRAALHASTPVDITAPIEIRSSASLFDPAIVGLFRPILLVPPGILEHLSPAQWEAVRAHELCHARRRDNLTSALHMVVEALFWFHPLVWWIGGRLVEERERACDEAVLSLGGEPRDYAEAIVSICKRYVKLPLECVSGVTGANLKKRIEEIMKNRVVRRLNFARKVALAGVGIAAVSLPILLGIVAIRAQTPQAADAPQIRPADQIPPGVGAGAGGGVGAGVGNGVGAGVGAGVGPGVAGIGAGVTPDGDSQRSLEVPLVTLRARIPSTAGASPTDLPQSAFKVYEDGDEQPLSVFRIQEEPISVGLVIDNSASMREHRAAVAAAGTALIKTSGPQDEIFIVHFNDDAYLDQPFTNDKDKLQAALERFTPRGGTAMREAVGSAIDYAKVKGKQNRKALIIVTDGEDNTSHQTLENLVRKAQQTGISIYSIALLDPDSPGDRNAKRALRALAEASGGVDYYPTDLAELERITPLIARDIHREYVLGYTPKNPSPAAASRKINVTVNGGRTPVRFRVDP